MLIYKCFVSVKTQVTTKIGDNNTKDSKLELRWSEAEQVPHSIESFRGYKHYVRLKPEDRVERRTTSRALWCDRRHGADHCTAAQSQKAVSAYLTSIKQRPFGFAEQHTRAPDPNIKRDVSRSSFQWQLGLLTASYSLFFSPPFNFN